MDTRLMKVSVPLELLQEFKTICHLEGWWLSDAVSHAMREMIEQWRLEQQQQMSASHATPRVGFRHEYKPKESK